jgi:hypothetical protein
VLTVAVRAGHTEVGDVLMFDNLFYLAIMALGFGLSLATYRLFALRYSWPMGAFHADVPAIPIMIGFVATVIGILFAVSRAETAGAGVGWMMIGTGIAFALIWTGLLRVGSQLSLFLAPLAAGLLLVGWLGSLFGYDRAANMIENPRDYLPKARIEDRTRDPKP